MVRFNLHSLFNSSHTSVLSIVGAIAAGKNSGTERCTIWHRSARSYRNNVVVLVNHLEVVSRQKMRDRRELGPIASSVVIELEQRHGKKFHVLWDGEDLCNDFDWVRYGNPEVYNDELQLTLLRQTNEVQLLALLRARNMSRKERVHEGLEIGSPPLRKCVANLPIVVNTFARELRAHWGEALIQSLLEALDFLVFVVQIIAGPESR